MAVPTTVNCPATLLNSSASRKEVSMSFKLARVAAYATLAFGAVLLAAGTATAADINIRDGRDGRIIIRACDFEGGYSVNGSSEPSGLGVCHTWSNPEENGLVTFDGSWIDLGQSGTGQRDIFFVERDNPGVVSDILRFFWLPD